MPDANDAAPVTAKNRYVDDCECRWQHFKRSDPALEFFELQFESLDQMNAGESYLALGEFLNLTPDLAAAARRDNSIQAKGRVKATDPAAAGGGAGGAAMGEAEAREQDEGYKRLVGECDAGGRQFRWDWER
mmetsp:Transcript_1249/g.3495  ORF Transcript_1249/g.3495 Transcript_1249/m.3495 type:complete len:132 (+) Transcript_1249:39-434(+)